ncbi:MAG: hypothetical protein WA857_20020 [Candidatus Acidiferrum sp.]
MTRRMSSLFSAFAIVVPCSVALLLAALAWASDPPWLGKPYQQWDDQDIQRIFTDSPWARVTPVIRNWVPLTSDELPNLIGGADRGLPTSPSDASSGELNFFVFWASSRVVRGASARRAVLHGPKKDIDIEKYANAPQAEYQIVVQSADMTPFFRQKEQFFQANSFLEMMGTKLKISPSHVHYERDAKEILVTSAIFYFPKKTPSGAPTISDADKLVDFIFLLEGTFHRVGFEPQKMVDRDGPAL